MRILGSLPTFQAVCVTRGLLTSYYSTTPWLFVGTHFDACTLQAKNTGHTQLQGSRAMIKIALEPHTTAEALRFRFRETFGTSPSILRAPGRVNLIGDHTDYNGGFVMPAAIPFYTWIAAAKREDRILEAYSESFGEKICLPLDALSGKPRKHWSDYLRGVAALLHQAGHRLAGANLVIHGDIPIGAGLSSSASFEVAIALALTCVSEIAVAPLELVELCQRAEHEYVGMHCGIMDQFIAVFGSGGYALMLDCRSNEYTLLPVPNDVRIVICNSMVKHELVSGEYNLRRKDCETGVKLLQAHLKDVQSLRDIDMPALERCREGLPMQVYRRCRHVVTENQRVLDAAQALKSKDAHRFGQLMYQSHTSLRDDYEVSCQEIDLLVDLARGSSGVYGARITGGGFGGCMVTLVRSDHVDEFTSHMEQSYKAATGLTPEIYIAEAVEGAGAWPSDRNPEKAPAP